MARGCRRLGMLAFALAMAGQVIALVGVVAPAQARSEGGTYAQVAFDATNAERRDAGLGELGKQRCLQKAAIFQARAMAAQERMFHQDIGRLLGGCNLNLVGENVAYGYPSGTSVVRDGWMKSPPHRANILNRSYSLMGLAARKGHNGKWYVSQVFGRRA
jgi:uncharacterized protein YkwD